MPWTQYQSISVPGATNTTLKNRYSITGDILSFQLCPSQYGFFAVKKFKPAHVLQAWYGTIMHQVLDKLHMHYGGLINPTTKGQIPTEQDVQAYFQIVESSLRARGVRAVDVGVRDAALRVLKIFNKVEGATLYPNVIDTECTLQADQLKYVLQGKVDLLKDISIGRAIPHYDSVELWDYKGSRFPDINTTDGTKKLERYTYQVLVYAQLYKLKTGNYPIKGVLYFMNELDTKPEPMIRPTQAVYEIDIRNPLNIQHIAGAMAAFGQTVASIEQCKSHNTWPTPKNCDKETCDICDIRWRCPGVKYRMRYP